VARTIRADLLSARFFATVCGTFLVLVRLGVVVCLPVAAGFRAGVFAGGLGAVLKFWLLGVAGGVGAGARAGLFGQEPFQALAVRRPGVGVRPVRGQ